MYRRRHIFEMVLAFFDSHLGELSTRSLILQLLERASQFASISGDLMESTAVAGWLRCIITSCCTQTTQTTSVLNPSYNRLSRNEAMQRIVKCCHLLCLLQKNVRHHITAASEEFFLIIPTLFYTLRIHIIFAAVFIVVSLNYAGETNEPTLQGAVLIALIVQYTCSVFVSARADSFICHITCDDILSLINAIKRHHSFFSTDSTSLQIIPDLVLKAMQAGSAVPVSVLTLNTHILRAMLLNTAMWNSKHALSTGVQSLLQLLRWALTQLPLLVHLDIPLQTFEQNEEDTVLACVRWIGALCMQMVDFSVAIVKEKELLTALLGLNTILCTHRRAPSLQYQLSNVGCVILSHAANTGQLGGIICNSYM